MRAEEPVMGEEHLPYNIHLCLRKKYHILTLAGKRSTASQSKSACPHSVGGQNSHWAGSRHRGTRHDRKPPLYFLSPSGPLGPTEAQLLGASPGRSGGGCSWYPRAPAGLGAPHPRAEAAGLGQQAAACLSAHRPAPFCLCWEPPRCKSVLMFTT